MQFKLRSRKKVNFGRSKVFASDILINDL